MVIMLFFGVMIESHLVEGRQDIVDGRNFKCMDKVLLMPALVGMILIKYYVNLLVMSESVVKNSWLML